MGLFDVILKLIKVLTLVSPTEHAELVAEVEDWKKDMTDKSEGLKGLYFKIHRGVLVKLAFPFIYFGLLKWVRGLSEGEQIPDYN